MVIAVDQTSKIHWNYFIALERELEVIARYVEFTKSNFEVYSIELARLLFAAASEAEVVAKLLCRWIEPSSRPGRFSECRKTLIQWPILVASKAHIPRYGLSFVPLLNWKDGKGDPDWWISYNKVKHQRDSFFPEATLQNALNAMGALLVFTLWYYRLKLADTRHSDLGLTDEEAASALKPQPTLMEVPLGYHDAQVLFHDHRIETGGRLR